VFEKRHQQVFERMEAKREAEEDRRRRERTSPKPARAAGLREFDANGRTTGATGWMCMEPSGN
jgi:hypothetical protein